MKHKTESWNGATSDSASSSVRRSLTRAGLQLGQLSHVVSGALGSRATASPRGAAQNRMRALLNQDRALLSHRAYGQANLEDELDAPQLPVKGPTRTAAQLRMRELLSQDRAMLAMREARRREHPASEPLDDDFAAELVQMVDREWNPVPDAPSTPVATASRSSCVGVSTSFVAEAQVPSVCTPGPVAAPQMSAASSAPVARSAVMQPAVAPNAPAAATSSAMPRPAGMQPPGAPAPGMRPAAAASARSAAPVAVPAPKPSVSVPSPKAPTTEEPPADPIRTRGMAKLLAMQGYRDRALSIYDELIAVEPDNAELRAEADRLRNN